MTGWWPGDGNTNDIGGGRNALRDNATTGPGLAGDAFLLDGDGDFVEVPLDPALNVGTGDFTVDFWVYFNTTEGEQVLMEKYIEDFTEVPPGWTVSKLAEYRLIFGAGPISGGHGVVSPPLSLPENTWIHIAARRGGGVTSIFVNGEEVASAPFVDNADATSSLKFGHRGDPDDTPGSLDESGFYLNGRIDEVELFAGRALSDGEIAAIFAAGSAGKCKPSASLVLTPRHAVNPVGTSHTVTATVFSATGQPVVGVKVRFGVVRDRRLVRSGQCVTAAGGQCGFTYQGPRRPAFDVIGAYADIDNDHRPDRGEPVGGATKRRVPPNGGGGDHDD